MATAWSRGLAAVLCIALALVGLGTAMHEVGVEHRRCAAHGEWIHVAGAPGHRAPADEDEHEHCPILTAHHSDASADLTRTQPGIAELPLARVGIAASPAGAQSERPVVHILVAPKTSPPVVG